MRIDNNMMSGMDTLEQTSRKKNVEKVSANDKQNSSVVESDEVSISEKGKDVSVNKFFINILAIIVPF